MYFQPIEMSKFQSFQGVIGPEGEGVLPISVIMGCAAYIGGFSMPKSVNMGQFSFFQHFTTYFSKLTHIFVETKSVQVGLCQIIHLNYPPRLEKNQEFTHLNWLKINLHLPPSLDKILEFTHLNRLKIHLNCPQWLDKILEFTHPNWLKIHLHFPTWLKKILKFTHLNSLKIHLNFQPWLEIILKFTHFN